MIKEVRSIIGLKVLHFDTGEPVALLNAPIINPDTGVIEAFWVKPLTISMADAVIQVSDITEFKKHVYVKSEQVIADPADIIRLSDILTEKRWFMNAPVRSEAGHGYGRVADIAFDTSTYMLRQIYVQKFLLGLFPFDRRIFAWERILKVLPDAIVIDDSSDAKETVVSDAAPAAG